MSSNPVAIATITEAALEAIHKITGVGGAKAGEALKAIRAIIDNLREGTRGTLDPQVVLAEIENLQARIDMNDDAADNELTARFDK